MLWPNDGQKSTERILVCIAQMSILNTSRHRMSRSTIKIHDVRIHMPETASAAYWSLYWSFSLASAT